MNIDWYRTFIVLAKHLNYRKASEEVFISPPSIFTQIKHIENELEVKLFEKKGRNIFLTADGERFLPLAVNAVETFENSVHAMNQIMLSKNISLKVVVSEYIADYLLPRILTDFLESNPDVDLRLTTASEEYMQELLENKKCDIAIGRSNFTFEGVKNVIINKCDIRLIVPISSYDPKKDERDYLIDHQIVLENISPPIEILKQRIINVCKVNEFKIIDNVKIVKGLVTKGSTVSYLPVSVLNSSNMKQMRIVEPRRITPPPSYSYVSYCDETVPVNIFLKFLFDFEIKKIV